jgi:antitoxin ParD1/3/4
MGWKSGERKRGRGVARSGLRLLEKHEADLHNLRTRLAAGLAEVLAGRRADGSGADAVRRAFARARGAATEG